jgi:hypothetical protein
MAGILRQIAVCGLFANIVFLVIAMALGGVEGSTGVLPGPLWLWFSSGTGWMILSAVSSSSTSESRLEKTPSAPALFRRKPESTYRLVSRGLPRQAETGKWVPTVVTFVSYSLKIIIAVGSVITPALHAAHFEICVPSRMDISRCDRAFRSV